jgi:AcrR family transcriptional regulator
MARPSDTHAKIDLLRAAEEVFVERGLDDARIEEITAKAGKSKGSFYLHFENKEDAFRQIVETMVARLAGLLEVSQAECEVAATLPFEQALELWHEKDLEMFEFLWQNRRVASLLLGGGGCTRYRYLIDEFAERAREHTKMYLERGIAAGHYRKDLDVEVASLLISGAYDRVARDLIRRTKKPDLRAWMREVQRLFLRGIGAEELRDVLDRPVIHPTVQVELPGRRAGGRGDR